MCEKNKKANISKIIISVLGIDPRTLGEFKLFNFSDRGREGFQIRPSYHSSLLYSILHSVSEKQMLLFPNARKLN